MKKRGPSKGGKQKQISQDLGRVVAVMLALSIVLVMTLSVVMFRSLVTGMLHDRCVSGTDMLAYELSHAEGREDINGMLDELKSRMDCEFTIFEGDTRAYTTAIQDGKRVVGTRLSSNIAAVVLQQGKSFVGEAEILDEKYLCSYVPTTGANGQVDGLLFAGISKASADRQTALVIALSAAVSVAAIAICVVLMVLYLKKRVSVPLAEITGVARRLERGTWACPGTRTSG